MEKHRVLAVDDDSEQIFMYNEKLASLYELKTTGSYNEAKSVWSNFVPDLVLLDITLPGKNGFDIFEEMKKEKSFEKTKVIFVSSAKSEEVKLHCYEMGTVDYIEKPFSMKELIAKMNVILGQSDKEKHLEGEIEKKNSELVMTSPLTYLGMHTLELVHNLKNLLTIINGNLHLAKSKCNQQANTYCDASLNYMDKIRIASGRIEEVIYLILEHTKDRIDFTDRTLDLNDIIAKEIKFVEEFQKNSKDVTIKLDLKFIPPIKGVYGHFSQIISNLVQNSFDAFQEKSKALEDRYFEKEIEISTHYDDLNGNKNIHIIFKDNGSGIKKENLDKIFNPFYSTKKNDKISGTGIGLSFVKDILDRYEGKITVNSRENEGTEFEMILPYKMQNPIKEDI